MITTCAAVTGTAVTAVAHPAIRDSGFIATSAIVWIQTTSAPTNVQVPKEAVSRTHILETPGVTTRTTTVAVIGTKVTAVELVATTVNSPIATSVNVWTHHWRHLVAPTLASAACLTFSATNDVMMSTITADADGTVAIVVEILVIRGSSLIAPSAIVEIRHCQRDLPVTEPAAMNSGKRTSAATMGITTVAVIGTAVTAAGKAATCTSLAIVQSVYAKMARKWSNNVQGTDHVVTPATLAIHVAMTQTTTAAAIGTMVIAAGKITTTCNSRTAPSVIVWIRSSSSHARVIAEVSITLAMAAAMTITTIVVVNMMVETVVEIAVTITNGPTVTIVSAWTQITVDPVTVVDRTTLSID